MPDVGMWKQLQRLLARVTTGHLNDTESSRVEKFLSENWDQLVEDIDGGMQGFKVMGRTEEMEWQPPLLSFNIERHGRPAVGSSRAQVQQWRFNTDQCRAAHHQFGFKQLKPMNPRTDFKSIAKEIAPLILERGTDARLQWIRDGKVRILWKEFLGGQLVSSQTLQGRRKRLREEILKRIKRHGWKASGSCFVACPPRQKPAQ